MKLFFTKMAMFAILMCAVGVTSYAQNKGDMAVGGNLVLGSGGHFTNYGIGAKFQYNVTIPIRLEGSFTYFPKKDYFTMWDLSVNAHYLFPLSGNIKAYPLAGLGLLNRGYDFGLGKIGYGTAFSGSDTYIALNLGGGIDCDLTDSLTLNFELKYKICDSGDRLLVSAGLAYKF